MEEHKGSIGEDRQLTADVLEMGASVEGYLGNGKLVKAVE